MFRKIRWPDASTSRTSQSSSPAMRWQPAGLMEWDGRFAQRGREQPGQTARANPGTNGLQRRPPIPFVTPGLTRGPAVLVSARRYSETSGRNRMPRTLAPSCQNSAGPRVKGGSRSGEVWLIHRTRMFHNDKWTLKHVQDEAWVVKAVSQLQLPTSPRNLTQIPLQHPPLRQHHHARIPIKQRILGHFKPGIIGTGERRARGRLVGEMVDEQQFVAG